MSALSSFSLNTPLLMSMEAAASARVSRSMRSVATDILKAIAVSKTLTSAFPEPLPDFPARSDGGTQRFPGAGFAAGSSASKLSVLAGRGAAKIVPSASLSFFSCKPCTLGAFGASVSRESLGPLLPLPLPRPALPWLPSGGPLPAPLPFAFGGGGPFPLPPLFGPIFPSGRGGPLLGSGGPLLFPLSLTPLPGGSGGPLPFPLLSVDPLPGGTGGPRFCPFPLSSPAPQPVFTRGFIGARVP
mmetsp:Transcript_37866/g.100823  ORF Transcript_37866/g.100823 Transcript_37866/m.100823 type:complete len:243 (-) Transcript_37866:577-1305(-)